MEMLMGKKKKINKPVKDLKDFDDPNSQINKNNYKLDQIGKKKRRKYVTDFFSLDNNNAV
tara:strand:- start:293 stop:472 length:180 start_codon:yes stop_codon:yes gene_type:complete